MRDPVRANIMQPMHSGGPNGIQKLEDVDYCECIPSDESHGLGDQFAKDVPDDPTIMSKNTAMATALNRHIV